MGMMKWAALAAVVWVGASAGWAQTPEVQQGIIVTGEGVVSSAPDMATITLGVTERADSAAAAMDQVAVSVAAILTRLDGLGIAARDRQTSGFYLRPLYDDRPGTEGGTQEVTGYQAGNSVTVEVRDLAVLGDVLDGVIAEGANDFNGLNFGLKDDKPLLVEARKRAVADAMDRAAQLADAAGVTLGAVLQISESSQRYMPMQMPMMEARGAMKDSIAQGEVDVSAQVTMVFGVAPKL